MANLQQLQDKLEKGLYLENLYEMARLCQALASDTIYRVAFFVMREIFLDIARGWDERAVPVEEAKRVEQQMLEPIRDLIRGIDRQAADEVILNLLNTVVSAYLVSSG